MLVFSMGLLISQAYGAAPGFPTGVKAIADSSSTVSITWNASAGADGYKIYRNLTKIGESTVNSYSDSGLTAETEYSYRVKAYSLPDIPANNSSFSLAETTTTLDAHTYRLYMNYSDPSVGPLIRTAYVHVPSSYNPVNPSALVFVIHGGLGNGYDQISNTQMNLLADASGFFVVYPEGYAHTWNAILPTAAYEANIDDIGFFNALISRLKAEYSIDPNRIYATGSSNGAQMAYRLAHHLPSQIAAIAPVAVSLGAVSDYDPGPLTHPVMVVHGSSDTHAPYTGGIGPDSLLPFDYIPIEIAVSTRNAVIPYLVGRSSSPPEKATYTPYDGYVPNSEITIRSWGWGAARAGRRVVLVRVNGGGHAWPGSLNPTFNGGYVTHKISATRAIWQFFSDHPRDIKQKGMSGGGQSGDSSQNSGAALVQAAEVNLVNVRIYPNPFYPNRGHTQVAMSGAPEGTVVKIYTLNGELLWDGNAPSTNLAIWDGTNKAGQKVASGLYLVSFEYSGKKKLKKISIVR